MLHTEHVLKIEAEIKEVQAQIRQVTRLSELAPLEAKLKHLKDLLANRINK